MKPFFVQVSLPLWLILFSPALGSGEQQPDIVLMMADDLGFSDLGCYGSEISTPNLDALASKGVSFSNFSNTSRCCPSRASLLTGLYAHRAGLGDMTNADRGPGYRGQLLAEVRTLPEYLSAQGYSTAMVGKWHLTRSKEIDAGPNGSWPWERGFDSFFGSMEGAKNYFSPKWLFDERRELIEFPADFYYTDAISTRAAAWIRTCPADRPLFLYTAFYAPHFPLQAPQREIDKYLGRYRLGWDELRKLRLAKQKHLGLLAQDVQLSTRPAEVPAWSSLSEEQRSESDRRMATYAAQVSLLDQGVGRIVEALRDAGRIDNTLLIFLSDNGAASVGGPFGAGPAELVGTPAAPIQTTYGKGWATLSNTPFVQHKANTHEGGVMAPLIVHWPSKIQTESHSHRQIRNDVAHIIDIAPTIVHSAGIPVGEKDFDGRNLLGDNAEGKSERAVFYEHQKSRAVRQGNWKLVNRGKSPEWELYNLGEDRTEIHNLASEDSSRMQQLVELWEQWAKRCHVSRP